jgi:phosphatidylglycerol:prolipoprotein diacylglycerol transferase
MRDILGLHTRVAGGIVREEESARGTPPEIGGGEGAAMMQMFDIGFIRIPAYGLFVGLAYAMGMYLAELRGRAIGLQKFCVFDVLAISFLCSLVGAWLFAPAFRGIHSGAEKPVIERSFFAGAILATVGGVSASKLKRIKVLDVFDCTLFYLPLVHGLGRLGCWFFGCCFGKVCSSSNSLAVQFPRLIGGAGQVLGTEAYMRHLESGLIPQSATFSATVYPVQLISVGLSLLLFLSMVLLSRLPRLKTLRGAITAAYCIGYGVLRFGEEFLRETTPVLFVFSDNQIASFALFLMGLALAYSIGRGKHQPLAAVSSKVRRSQRRRA